jgi:tRNA pseudouridine55 synthase
MDGIVLIDKPKGWTSFDVVAKTRGMLKQETGLKKPKVGHTGTLDPLATGLLVIVTGSYCKRAQEFSKLDKTYEAELTLGYISSTDDDQKKRQDPKPRGAASHFEYICR